MSEEVKTMLGRGPNPVYTLLFRPKRVLEYGEKREVEVKVFFVKWIFVRGGKPSLEYRNVGNFHVYSFPMFLFVYLTCNM